MPEDGKTQANTGRIIEIKGVQDDALDLDDPTGVRLRLAVLGHGSPRKGVSRRCERRGSRQGESTLVLERFPRLPALNTSLPCVQGNRNGGTAILAFSWA